MENSKQKALILANAAFQIIDMQGNEDSADEIARIRKLGEFLEIDEKDLKDFDNQVEEVKKADGYQLNETEIKVADIVDETIVKCRQLEDVKTAVDYISTAWDMVYMQNAIHLI